MTATPAVDPAAKARWFSTPTGEHKPDFRVGGREVDRAHHDGQVLTLESWYQDIVTDHRIVYASALYGGAELATVSLTTVELTPADGGTLLTLAERGTFLDGREDLDWRQGTGDRLGALGALGADLRRG